MSKFIVTKERLARWYEVGEEVEINNEQEVSNLLRDGRINVPPEPVSFTASGEPLAEQEADRNEGNPS